MKGKITVMTIVTGVKSPWVLGKEAHKSKEYESEMQELNDELGIEIIR